MALAVIGSYNQDYTYYTPAFPAPGETRLARFETGHGGKGYNQFLASWLMAGLRSAIAGGRPEGQSGACASRPQAVFVACLGQDDAAARALADWGALGLPVIAARSRKPTGNASVWVCEATGENQILVAAGANDDLCLGAVRRDLEARRPGAVLMQGEIGIGATSEFLRWAGESGCLRILNPAPFNPGPHWGAVAGMVDVLVVNRTEAEQMLEELRRLCMDALGQHVGRECFEPVPLAESAAGLGALLTPSGRDLEDSVVGIGVELVARLRERRARAQYVIITLGSSGSAVFDVAESRAQGSSEDLGGLDQPGVVRYYPVRCYRHSLPVLDTSGAGDCFIGTVASYLCDYTASLGRPEPSGDVTSVEAPSPASARPLPLRVVLEACALGSIASGIAVTRRGTSKSFPAVADVLCAAEAV